MHEKNSEKEIDVGSFEDIAPKAILKNNPKIKPLGSQSTLRKMSLIFTEIDPKSEIFEHTQNAMLYFFDSPKSGNGCAFRYQNANHAEFVCVIFGEMTKEASLSDVGKIIRWLDQFYEYEIKTRNVEKCMIPVIYGEEEEIPLPVHSKKILLSTRASKKISITERNIAIVKAPISEGDILGHIFYRTEIFQNPITDTIKTDRHIERANWGRCIIDSIKYLLFGTTMNREAKDRITQ